MPGPRGPRGPKPKIKNPGKLFARLMGFIFKKYLPACIIVVICIFVSVLANVQGTMFTKNLIDDYIVPLLKTGNPDYGPLLAAMGRVAVFYGIGVISTFAYSKIMIYVSQGTIKNLRVELFSHMQAPDGWIAVVSDSQTGYIAADYATRSLNTRVGITIEEEQAQIAAQKEAERKAAEEKAAKEAAKAAKESKKTETTQGEAVSAGADDLTLLAAIIECEAGGESYECQLAVGAAVINRVKSGSYPNSISGVIYQKGQFGPASSGKLARKLSGRISSSCYSAAQEAMSGVDNTGGCTSFNDHGSGISIGNMKFR